jgi:hypothetical protein
MVKKINLVVADMGYGHQRAAFPLLHLAANEAITINEYPGISDKEKQHWQKNLEAYEKISRFKKIPLLGQAVFAAMDYFQKIPDFYPFRDLSRPTPQQLYFYKLIKGGLGKDLIDKLNHSNLPLVTTFFVAMYIAEYHNYQGDIYCIVCDADVSRAWAPIRPEKSRTKFFVPSDKVKTRLMMYGVKEENVFVTGFPLPQTNTGVKKEIIIKDLSRRLVALDPSGKYRALEKPLVHKIVPKSLLKKKAKTLSITFAVGGAGAQKEIAVTAMQQLSEQIRAGKIKLNLVAGSRKEVAQYFTEERDRLGLSLKDGVRIIYQADKNAYFKEFNEVLHTSDILWTKPSELSFYSALGMPVLMSETVGSQEDYNQEWLLKIGAGVASYDPGYINEWLPEMLNSGQLARAAMAGFLQAEFAGAYNIEKIFSKK